MLLRLVFQQDALAAQEACRGGTGGGRARVRGNSTASLLHTAIDCACSAAKPNFFQLTAGEIVPKSSQTPNQL